MTRLKLYVVEVLEQGNQGAVFSGCALSEAGPQTSEQGCTHKWVKSCSEPGD